MTKKEFKNLQPGDLICSNNWVVNIFGELEIGIILERKRNFAWKKFGSSYESEIYYCCYFVTSLDKSPYGSIMLPESWKLLKKCI